MPDAKLPRYRSERRGGDRWGSAPVWDIHDRKEARIFLRGIDNAHDMEITLNALNASAEAHAS